MGPHPRGLIAQDLLSRREGFHGSDLHKIARIHAPGVHIDNAALEDILNRLVEAGQIKPRSKPTPTPSQAAFLGLQYDTHPGYVPGAKLHFWFDHTGVS